MVFKFILKYITIVIIIVVLPFVLWIIFLKELPRTFYGETAKVVIVGEQKVYVETAEGIRFDFYNENNWKWKENDCVSLIIYNNGTPDNYNDDSVICARYSAWDITKYDTKYDTTIKSTVNKGSLRCC